MLRLAAERDELKVVGDQIGSPTFTGHLAAALVGLAEQREPTAGIVHLAASGECSWCDFARAEVEAGKSRRARGRRPACPCNHHRRVPHTGAASRLQRAALRAGRTGPAQLAGRPRLVHD